jgi:predicted ABC-type ATPase
VSPTKRLRIFAGPNGSGKSTLVQLVKDLNVRRVETRVSMKGHDVTSNKIVERYPKSMDMLLDAILLADKSFIFDNSGEKPIMIVNSDKDEISVLEEGNVPYWFKKYVLDKLG